MREPTEKKSRIQIVLRENEKNVYRFLTGDKTGRLVQKEREGGWTNNTKII